jgi:hypothetical protein
MHLFGPDSMQIAMTPEMDRLTKRPAKRRVFEAGYNDIEQTDSS